MGATDRVLRDRTIADGLHLVHKTYPKGLRMGRHAHDEWRFCLALEGSYTDSWRRGYRTRSSWHLSLHPAGEIHTSVFHAASACFHIEFLGGWQDRLLGDAGIAPEPQEFLTGPVPLLAAQLFRASDDRDACSSLVIQGLACELIGWAGRELQMETRVPSWLHHARDLLHDRFSESLCLHDIATIAGVHPVHLAREFRRHFGCTVGDYVRRLRVEYVSQRLSAETPLADLALQAGFSDQSHLSRVFKQVTGRTPRQTRLCRNGRR
jgi:AraC family transcriptional regulator